jgi:hypothetical protein
MAKEVAMSSSGLFAIGLVIAMAFSAAAVVYLRRPLLTILVDLCGSRERAGFWVAFSNVTLLLVPLLFAMQYTPALTSGETVLLEIATQLKWALFGLLAAVCVLGCVIGRFVRRPPAATPMSRAA